MKNKMVYIILGLITCIFVFSVTLLNNNLNETTVNTNSQVLSNKKIGWGINRNDKHEQPDLGSSNLKLLQEYDGIAIGNNEEKFVYLTFDNGYEAGYTSKLLDTLKENNVKAAFFITAHYLNTAPDLVKRMLDEGHIVGNHTVNHYSMPDITDEKIKEEVMNLHAALYEKFGYEMEYIRPPKGEFSERTLSVCNSLGYKTVMWSFAYDDWDTKKQGKQQYAKDKILNNVHNGEIILLHATSSDNCEILSEVIKEIKAQGYEFKSLDEFSS